MPVFDEPNLVSAAGLVPVLELAESVGFSARLAALVTVASANVAAEVRTIVAGMLAGADSIDDLDVLRSGGNARVLGEVRAPSTIGTFLRSFTHGHVQQLHSVSKAMLVALDRRVPALVADGDLVFLDMDDTIREVHGYKKQGAAFGYSGVRGLNALLAVISTPTSAPVIAECSLRRGQVRSGKGAAWYLTRALTTAAAVSDGQVWVRGDSAFATFKNVAAATKAGAWFSFTAPAWPTVRAAISSIKEEDWTTIKYPNAIFDETSGQWISEAEAEVAEVEFVAFVSRVKSPGPGKVVC